VFRPLLLLALIVLTVIVSLVASNAYANESSDIFTRFRKEIPEVPLLEESDFIKKTKPIKRVPYGVKELAYTLRIPKEWDGGKDVGTSNFLVSEKLFVELNSFKGKPSITGRSRIEVQAIKIENNLTAEQWYLEYILDGGYAVEGFETHNENKVETLMVQNDENFSYFVRSLAFLNGNYMVVVRYFVPVKHIQSEAVMQAQVIKSFELTNPQEREKPEFEIYRFLDVAEVNYPKSWRLFTKPMRSVDYMDVTLMNIQEVKRMGQNRITTSSASNGKMDVVVVSASAKPKLIEEIAEYRRKIESDGILIGKRMNLYGEISYDDSMDFYITEAYDGIDSSNNLSEYEIWFTVMVGGNYYYFLMLLTPSRNENFSIWAENIQNYKLMVEHFKPMTGAFLDRK